MGTRYRTRRQDPGPRITPEAVAAYRAGDELALHRALRLRPWQASPIGAVGPCPWPPGTGGHESWALAVELRAELERA